MCTISVNVCDVSTSTTKQEHATQKATHMSLTHILIGEKPTKFRLFRLFRSSLFEAKGRTCKRGTVQLARTRDTPRAKQSYTENFHRTSHTAHQRRHPSLPSGFAQQGPTQLSFAFDFIRVRQRSAPIDSDLQIAMVQSIFLACSLITSCIQLGGWAVAYALRTEKLYDILGGLNFLAVGAFSAATAEGWEADPRKVWW